MNKIIIKLSGESLQNNEPLDSIEAKNIAIQLLEIYSANIKIGVVIGGGNIMRGKKSLFNRVIADEIGMLSTVINAMFLKETIQSISNMDLDIYSAIQSGMVSNYERNKAQSSLDKGIVIFAGGIGNPYFSTDTGAAVRAIDMKCNMIVKATTVDGVYDLDPKTNKNAVMHKSIHINDVINNKIEIMDMTALILCAEHNINIHVVNCKNISQCILNGYNLGTSVLSEET